MHVQSILAVSLSVLAITTSAQPVAFNSDGTVVKPGRPGGNHFSLISDASASGDVDKRDPIESNVRTGRPAPGTGTQKREPGGNGSVVKPSRPGQKRDPGLIKPGSPFHPPSLDARDPGTVVKTGRPDKRDPSVDAILIKPSGPSRAGAKRENINGGIVKPGRPGSKRDPGLIKPGGPGHAPSLDTRDPAYVVKTGRPDRRDPGTDGWVIKPAGPNRAGSRRDPGTAAVVVKSGRPGQQKRDPSIVVKTGRPEKRDPSVVVKTGRPDKREAEIGAPLVKPGRPVDS